MSWAAAQAYCREKFDDLATVDNVYDNQKLLTLALNSNVRVGGIWIGLYDDINIWKWSMEERNFNISRDADFLTWLKGQPNNKNGNQMCVIYYSSAELNDLFCGECHPFVCYDGMIKLLLLVIPTISERDLCYYYSYAFILTLVFDL